MPPEFGRKWRTECPNTRFPLSILQCAEYSVKLIHLFYIYFRSLDLLILLVRHLKANLEPSTPHKTSNKLAK